MIIPTGTSHMILKFLQIVMQRMVFHTLFVTNMVLKTSLLLVQ